MIYFNDISMDSIAPVKIEDIRVSPISYSVTARQRPIQYGADFVRETGGSRTVTITFAPSPKAVAGTERMGEDRYRREVDD